LLALDNRDRLPAYSYENCACRRTVAKKCGIRVPDIPAGSLAIAGDRDGREAVYFKQADVTRILKLAREPYRTIFTLAAVTGLRAGELLGLTVADVDLSAQTGRRSDS
jgi:integrase